jgi:hypothetical protein
MHFFEAPYIDLVNDRNPQVVMNAVKLFCGELGYREKVEHDHKGEITHEHGFGIDELDLPLEIRKEILTAMRKKGRFHTNGDQRT